MSYLKQLVLDFYRDTKVMIDELEKTPPPAGSPEEGLLIGLRVACRGYEGRGAPASHDPACDIVWDGEMPRWRRAGKSNEKMTICGPCFTRMDGPGIYPKPITDDPGTKTADNAPRVDG